MTAFRLYFFLLGCLLSFLPSFLVLRRLEWLGKEGRSRSAAYGALRERERERERERRRKEGGGKH
jgi:hypothetical protein